MRFYIKYGFAFKGNIPESWKNFIVADDICLKADTIYFRKDIPANVKAGQMIQRAYGELLKAFNQEKAQKHKLWLCTQIWDQGNSTTKIFRVNPCKDIFFEKVFSTGVIPICAQTESVEVSLKFKFHRKSSDMDGTMIEGVDFNDLGG